MKTQLKLFVGALLIIFLAFSFFTFTSIKNAYAGAKAINSVQYFKTHTLKIVYQVPQNPKKWPMLMALITAVVKDAHKNNVHYKLDVVAWGPAIRIFMKTDAKYYKTLHSFAVKGIKLVVCHRSEKGMYIKKSGIYNFANIDYPDAEWILAQKEMQGYAYIKP